ncbi:DUF5819 family protein [Streptomyces sp. LaPpAH-108]|uniref:DUF5819 family protein n=1 Tax=Streptomyces sp. LaPpAH-108 TaxID=1155714 RepID=UPI0003786900|nr:DUF5819 family protein [Streptomyces sp. LaPpAH-108]
MEQRKGVGETGLRDAAPHERPYAGGVLAPGPNGSWSIPSRLVLAGVLVVATTAVAVHLLLLFLYLAPANAVSRNHTALVNGYVYPEFDQNWKLFAPNPLQGNITVDARAQVRLPDGSVGTTGWTSLTGQDLAEIRDNPAPSHAHQNLLRQAWDFFTRTHDAKGAPLGLRGELAQDYVRRIAAQRLGPQQLDGQIVAVQLRSTYHPIAPPAWSGESEESDDTRTTTETQAWWPVTEEDFR